MQGCPTNPGRKSCKMDFARTILSLGWAELQPPEPRQRSKLVRERIAEIKCRVVPQTLRENHRKWISHGQSPHLDGLNFSHLSRDYVQNWCVEESRKSSAGLSHKPCAKIMQNGFRNPHRSIPIKAGTLNRSAKAKITIISGVSLLSLLPFSSAKHPARLRYIVSELLVSRDERARRTDVALFCADWIIHNCSLDLRASITRTPTSK